ncbi:uncharacterized protein [Primulina huaijiensis]|uniref:uncharacterized protein n=1 Tax=Primulina huaijiensis TaxID=1492673 RepID=UPI003CC799E4
MSTWVWYQSIILGTNKGFGDRQIGAISWRLQFDRVGGQATNINKDKKVSVSVVSSISGISSEDWDACSLDASGPEKFNPFLTHGFLSALEETPAPLQETGWVPQHIIARDDSNNILEVIPLYLKSHSYSEYVFDHSWADAYYSYGSRFYPKLQCCVPFTPVTGPRILVRNTMFRDKVFDNLVSALLELTVKAKHWETFYKFYRNTTDNKWGSAYLTRHFFHNMASKMGDHVLLVTAEEGDELIAGALNLIGGDTLYGHLWGFVPRAYYPNLHFEACYYQAIDAAIELNLDKVEAGAQGEHKIQRGYLPVETYSLHYILDEDFRKVLSNFLVRESVQGVEWGSVSLVDAEKRLLANALLDFSNERFILLSESCIPVYNFPIIYSYLIESTHSFVQSYDDPSRYGRGRYSRSMRPDIKLANWRKGSQWFELHRTLAIKIISDTKYYRIFEKYCTPSCYPDEHYIPTFLHMFHGSLNANRTITYVDWSQIAPHPASFSAVNITESFIQSIRNNGTLCSYNFEKTHICYLFARKFDASALERLLNVTSKIMGF